MRKARWKIEDVELCGEVQQWIFSHYIFPLLEAIRGRKLSPLISILLFSLSWSCSCSCSCGSSLYRTEIFNNLTKWITIGNLQQPHGDEKCARQTLKVEDTIWKCTIKISLFIHDFSLHCLPEPCLAILNNKSEKSTEKCENLFFHEENPLRFHYWQDRAEEPFNWDGQWRFFGILLH